MNDYVWVCQGMSDATLILQGLNNDIRETDFDRAVAIRKKIEAGESLPREDFPQTIWGQMKDYRSGQRPDLFCSQGYWAVSSKAADILGRYDLGGGGLFPVILLEEDRIKPVPGEWFCWNIGNVKRGLLPEASTGLSRPMGGVFGIRQPSDCDIKCRRDVVSGAAVWMDPSVDGAFFMHQDLGQALIDAGLANEKSGFGELIKCALI